MEQVTNEVSTTISNPIFHRKFAVEFLDNIEEIKKKTSLSKKTCRALLTFFTERVAIEEAYSNKLAALSRNGNNLFNMVGGVIVNFGYSYSILDYKDKEES